MKDCRAGSKKQDLSALAAILVAWQVGVDTYMDRMKKISYRITFITEYVSNKRNNRWVQEIAQGALLSGEACLTLAQIKEIMDNYLQSLPTLKLEDV
jgi:hypothetical protein